ncbi:MAG: group II intron reverse transcriptase/maturase [Desulfovibrio sp.]|nr:group II intron reverse transcriptase/maturase [Desulfovibrio sp.]
MSLETPKKIRKLQRALYGKAKQAPEYRFYLLYDKVYREDILYHAWRLSREKRGAPGVDGQTFEDIEGYGVEKWLGELGEEVKEERYKPQPVRRVMIPKPGGVGERPLGIPTIRDRVVQTAAKLVLEPIFEADFEDSANGYRPGRSALDAVEKVHGALWNGHRQVVDADVTKYFDTIPHAELMVCLARRISDARMLRLLKSWLKVPVEERDDKGNARLTGGKGSKQGTPQGGVISPLLANIYINRFLKAFRLHGLDKKYGAVLVNYADDFVILCRHGAKAVLARVNGYFEKMKLSLNQNKTSVRNARNDHFTFLGYTFGPRRSKVDGRSRQAAVPASKALQRFHTRIRELLRPGNQTPIKETVARLNRRLRGWANYFCYDNVGPARQNMDLYVYDRIRSFLRRRHKVGSLGADRFPMSYVFGSLGVVSLRRLPRRRLAQASS